MSADSELLAVAQLCTLRTVEKSEKHILAMQGEFVSSVFIIIKGSIELDYGKKISVKSDGSLLGGHTLTSGLHVWDCDVISTATYIAGKGTRAHTKQLATATTNNGTQSYLNDAEQDEQDEVDREKANNENVILLEIPLSVLLNLVGQEGEEGPEHLMCLLQFLRMSHLLYLKEYEALFVKPKPEPELESTEPSLEDNEFGSGEHTPQHTHTHKEDTTSFAARLLQQQEDKSRKGDAEYFGTDYYLGNDGMTDYEPNNLPQYQKAIVGDKGNIQFSLPQTPPPTPPQLVVTRLNIVNKARVRCFGAGEVVFHQGDVRRYFFLIVKGESGYYRKLTDGEDIPEYTTSDENDTDNRAGKKPLEGKGIEVDVGLRLLGGDISLLDGENSDWIDKKRSEKMNLLPNGIEYTKYGRTHPVYGNHKYTLIARTRLEVCFVPLSEIAQCKELFTALLNESIRRYSALQYKDIQLQAALFGRKNWSYIKDKTIKFVNPNIATNSNSKRNSKGAVKFPVEADEVRSINVVKRLEKKMLLENKAAQHPVTEIIRGNTPAHALLRAGVHSSLWPPPVPLPDTEVILQAQAKIRKATASKTKILKFTKARNAGFAVSSATPSVVKRSPWIQPSIQKKKKAKPGKPKNPAAPAAPVAPTSQKRLAPSRQPGRKVVMKLS